MLINRFLKFVEFILQLVYNFRLLYVHRHYTLNISDRYYIRTGDPHATPAFKDFTMPDSCVVVSV